MTLKTQKKVVYLNKKKVRGCSVSLLKKRGVFGLLWGRFAPGVLASFGAVLHLFCGGGGGCMMHRLFLTEGGGGGFFPP